MDDNDVCPLCCEELDLSDQQFYPCKCGYQVCMWCWHRIRESESGLCPACRTPYGDDPHEFSAVDVAEVLKANKEKAAAEKKEKERLRQQMSGDGDGMHSRSMSDGDGINLMGMGRGPMDLPKDRNQLANMRVIRRNLVYAVGLPPTIASEDTLRKPDYVGQYGKISKIVLNRNNTTGGDPRRASASAYVTFAHKEDTLACILALDGFYVDGRNVRASYGTSKYCSAFIKNVRCNNPECTYLHHMGDAEDTFTKQEIQAGYVTSGRDVLARQQQIVAQALAAGSAAGGSGSRRKSGGGGPSGTGKASATPQFPPPTYDEPLKSSATAVPPLPPASAATRTASTGSAFSAAAAAATSTPIATSVKSVTSNSIGAPIGAPMVAPVAAARGNIASIGGTSNATFPQARKSILATAAPAPAATGPGATAASIVAGGHSAYAAAEAPAPHTTLTPLTPLKRASTLSAQAKNAGIPGIKSVGSADSGSNSAHLQPNMPVPKGLTPEQRVTFLEQRREAMAALVRQQNEMANMMKMTSLRQQGPKSNGVVPLNGQYGIPPTSPSSSITSAGPVGSSASLASGSANSFGGVGSIGGTIIGGTGVGSGSIGGAPIGGSNFGSQGGLGGVLGGPPLGHPGVRTGATSALGGEIYNGHSSLLGGGGDNRNSQQGSNSGLFSSGSNNGFALNSGGIWDGASSNDGASGQGRSPGVIGGNGKALGAIGSGGMGGSIIGGTPFGNTSSNYNAGSSALASMLGINLPSRPGTLRESTPLWDSSNSTQIPTGAGVIGSGVNPTSAPAPIGGFAIGSGGFPSNNMAPNPVGGNNNRDIALLQTLLPGVHITSGNNQQPAAPSSGGFGVVGGAGWSAPGQPAGQAGIGGLNGNPQHQVGDTWGNAGGQPGPVVGAPRGGILGQNAPQQNQKQGQGQQSSIW